MPSYTTNLNLTKSTVGGDTNVWGGHLNGNADTIDGIFADAGNGTSVGLNVGSGKTLTVAGTANFTGTTTFSSSGFTLNSLSFIDYSSGFRIGALDNDDETLTLKGFGGSTSMVLGEDNITVTGSVTIGQGQEADQKIVFSGNSETFHVGLDDSTDDLVIGKGSTLGTEPRIQFDGQGAVRIISDAPAYGQLTLADIGANADQAFFKQDGGTLSILAQQSTTQTGTVIIGGQNNTISATYAQFNSSGVTLNGASVTIGTGSLFLTNSSSQGIHLQSPNGTEFKITVDNSGNLVATEV